MKTPILLFLLGCSLTASAQVKMQPLFTDNMVLQQQTDAPIWGEDKAGKTITVTTSWNKKRYTTKADAQGRWKVSVATPEAGGPYNITISDGKPVTLKNVLIGEVWLCTGQSNMEMPIVGWGHEYFKEEHKDADNHPRIRLLQLEQATSTVPKDAFKARSDGWMVCNFKNLADFSATGYFFGRDIEKYRNVPVGLIETCWGGTVAEAWTSGESLRQMLDFAQAVEKVKTMPDNVAARRAQYEREWQQWNDEVGMRDKGMKGGEAVWAAPMCDVGTWQTMTVPGKLADRGMANVHGVIWFRKTIDVPKAMAGKELVLNLGPVDDNDVTYFNGQVLGHTEGWNVNRSYKVPARMVKAGRNVVTVRVIDTGGDGGIYGTPEQMSLSTAKGSQLSLAGDWLYRVGCTAADMPSMPVDASKSPNVATVLYNAMIHPLVPYALQGAIWYQGEANADRAYQYRDLLPLMIGDWRMRWGKRFPFYIVQLANYMQRHGQPTESAWAELREAQAMTTHLDNTGMACAIDIGMADDIHPSNKQDVGKRLALVARAKTYGEDIECYGPTYRSYQIEDGSIRIVFDHAGSGLRTNDGKPVTGFAIAGLDHKWHFAQARIDGQTVVVSSPEVPHPVAVRYAWADNPACNLYNGADLPTVPFRTDDWQGVTYGRK